MIDIYNHSQERVRHCTKPNCASQTIKCIHKRNEERTPPEGVQRSSKPYETTLHGPPHGYPNTKLVQSMSKERETLQLHSHHLSPSPPCLLLIS
jgi:hypothetical protein